MRQPYVMDVDLTLLGPILTRGGELTEPGIDAPIARDAFGRFMLPYSLVKGKVLDAFRDLPGVSRQDVENWLGRGSDDGGWEPERGRVRFGDFVTEHKATTRDGVIERISIDADTGTAKGRQLAMLEAPFGYGEPVTFRGRIDFIADAAEAGRIHEAVDQALRFVPAYGAMRTVGFGRTKAVVTELKLAGPPERSLPPASNVLPLELGLDRPLCLVGPKHSRNHFESLQNISGSVLKGAVARLMLELSGSSAKFVDPTKPLPRFPKLSQHLTAIRFSEARPRKADDPGRPVILPLSLVITKTDVGKVLNDVALEPKPRLIGGGVPAFFIDWKWDEEEKKLLKPFGVPKLPTERRTRTQIDPTTGRAKENNLFSYGLVQPKSKAGGEYTWDATIGLDGVPDQVEVRAELADLLSHGLPNIGKTRAIAAVRWLTAPLPLTVGTAKPPGDAHAVTLQTDCLMTDPEALQRDGLRAAYAEFWTSVSGGSVQLVRHFAKQTLHGGYLSKRTGRTYEPFLLTDRGSVFVLRAVGDKADALLTDWALHGLPTPAWVEKRYGAGDVPLWKVCPFLPQVGYGEVTVDLACHVQNRPPQETA